MTTKAILSYIILALVASIAVMTHTAHAFSPLYVRRRSPSIAALVAMRRCASPSEGARGRRTSHPRSMSSDSSSSLSDEDEKSESSSSSGESGEKDADADPPSPPSPTQKGPPSAKRPRLDPLVASLTRMDPQTASAETMTVPLFGEIPKDGSIIPLSAAAVIALLGFVTSINIAFNSKDAILAQVQETTDVLSTSPVMKTVPTKDDGCRGICGSQQEDLDSLRNFMGRFSK